MRYRHGLSTQLLSNIGAKRGFATVTYFEEKSLNSAVDEARVRLRHARSSAYLGDEATGSHEVRRLRGEFDIHIYPHLAADIIATEGVLDATAGRWYQAIDRLRRSIAVSKLIPVDEIASLSSVWLSHCEYNVGRMLESAKRLASVRLEDLTDNLEILHRFATVLGQHFGYCDRRDISEAWSNCAKQAAAALGLNSLFSAGIYNMCALRVWQDVLLPRVHEREFGGRIAADLLFLESTENYDNLTKTSQRTYLRILLRAQLNGACGNLEISNQLLDKLDSLPDVEHSRVVLERIWNLIRADKINRELSMEEAMRRLSMARAVLFDVDDLAFVELLSRDLARIQGDTHGALQFESERARYVSTIQHSQKELFDCLRSMNLPQPESLIVSVNHDRFNEKF